jgi:hypothetical protein
MEVLMDAYLKSESEENLLVGLVFMFAVYSVTNYIRIQLLPYVFWQVKFVPIIIARVEHYLQSAHDTLRDERYCIGKVLINHDGAMERNAKNNIDPNGIGHYEVNSALIRDGKHNVRSRPTFDSSRCEILASWDDGHTFSIDKLGGSKGKDGMYEWGRLACGDWKGSWVKLRNRGQWIVAVLAEPQVVCSFCGIPQVHVLSQKNFLCRGCKQVVYCSTECQVNHWKAGHEDECAKETKAATRMQDNQSDSD